MRAKDTKTKKLVPPLEELKAELEREQNKYRRVGVLKSAVYTLIVVAAIALLLATLWMPVLQINGSSMLPTLKEGQIVVSLKASDFEQGDLAAFYIGNELLVERIIAGPNQIVSITEDGVVSVDGMVLDEPYVQTMALGDCDLEFPYKVPGTGYFVMGDQRSNSVDSRNSVVGAISRDDIIGKICVRVWPLSRLGLVY